MNRIFAALIDFLTRALLGRVLREIETEGLIVEAELRARLEEQARALEQRGHPDLAAELRQRASGNADKVRVIIHPSSRDGGHQPEDTNTVPRLPSDEAIAPPAPATAAPIAVRKRGRPPKSAACPPSSSPPPVPPTPAGN
jgi:hypothetical protein